MLILKIKVIKRRWNCLKNKIDKNKMEKYVWKKQIVKKVKK